MPCHPNVKNFTNLNVNPFPLHQGLQPSNVPNLWFIVADLLRIDEVCTDFNNNLEQTFFDDYGLPNNPGNPPPVTPNWEWEYIKNFPQTSTNPQRKIATIGYLLEELKTHNGDYFNLSVPGPLNIHIDFNPNPPTGDPLPEWPFPPMGASEPHVFFFLADYARFQEVQNQFLLGNQTWLQHHYGLTTEEYVMLLNLQIDPLNPQHQKALAGQIIEDLQNPLFSTYIW